MSGTHSGRRCQLVVLLMFLAAILCSAITARAEDPYPRKAFKLMVPWSPGGGTDRSARAFAPVLAKYLGQPVGIINVDGGGGWVGWAQAAKWTDPENDHDLAYVNLPHILSFLDPRLKRTETLDSFGWLALHTVDPCIWVIRENETRYRDVEGFVEYVKENPGKVTFAVSGVGGDDHLGAVAGLRALEEKYGGPLKVTFTYSNGDGERIAALLGGSADVLGGNVAYYIAYAMEAQMKPICVLAKQRVRDMPTVPTLAEYAGKPIVVSAARYLAVAKNMPEYKRKILLDAVQKAYADPEYIITCNKMGDVVQYVTGEDLRKQLEEFKALAESVAYWKDAQ